MYFAYSSFVMPSSSSYNNHLTTSPGGSATGFGANLRVLDDIVKNAEEAHNELTKDEQWTWFTQTMLSRLEEDGKKRLYSNFSGVQATLEPVRGRGGRGIKGQDGHAGAEGEHGYDAYADGRACPNANGW